MIIMGINCAHDGTAALVRDGEILAAVAEERLSRKKYHLGFPYRAIRECLRLAGLGPEQVDYMVVPFREYLQAHPLFIHMILQEDGSPIDVGNEIGWWDTLSVLWEMTRKGDVGYLSLQKVSVRHESRARSAYEKALAQGGLSGAKLVTMEHHRAHAASAYYTSGFEPCLVLTIDGSGDGLSATASIGREGRISRLAETRDCFSPGVFYSAVTKYLGFKRHRHEGKITGLAAYGDPQRCYHIMSRILTLTPDGRGFASDLDFNFSIWQKLRWVGRLFTRRFFRSMVTNYLLDYFRDNLQNYSREDIAAAAQKRLEDCAAAYARTFVRETGIRKVALAGGVFANVRVNQKILELPEVEEIYIHPNMGDGGTSVGGALALWHDFSQGQHKGYCPSRIRDVYLGPAYSEEEILQAVTRHGLKATRYEDIAQVVARLIMEKKVVGWFHGKMEYGPRALGSRSILAEATDRTINDWLNHRLRRTEFMPFAPSILEEAAIRHYDGYASGAFPAEFMTITFNVRDGSYEVAPAVCHVDHTARPQVVREDVNPTYYRILKEYERMTGLPMIVNTSFNAHEEPIVCTPDDAIASFLAGSVDVLVLSHYVVANDKKGQL